MNIGGMKTFGNMDFWRHYGLESDGEITKTGYARGATGFVFQANPGDNGHSFCFAPGTFLMGDETSPRSRVDFFRCQLARYYGTKIEALGEQQPNWRSTAAMARLRTAPRAPRHAVVL